MSAERAPSKLRSDQNQEEPTRLCGLTPFLQIIISIEISRFEFSTITGCIKQRLHFGFVSQVIAEAT